MKPKRFGELSVGTKLYVSAIIMAGAVTVAHSVHALIAQQTPWNWTILALLTLVSGSATVKLPGLPATISISETFVFTSVLLFGVPAGTLTVALDAFVISLWSYRKSDPLYKIVFNLFALPVTIWTAGQVFFSLPEWKPFLSRMEPLFQNPHPFQVIDLLGPLIVLALVYFSLNSWLIAFAIGLEKNLSPVNIWRDNFALLSLNYFGGASVAALLVTYTRNIEWAYIALIVPLLVILYFTFSTSMGRVADANRHLSELNSLYMSTIETLAMAIDAKDQITHGHIRRVQQYAVMLAGKVGVTDPPLIKAIEAAALLHDMGKLAVPEYILNKPGPLTPAEFEKMKLHASVGADILSAVNFPYPVVPIVRHHHENWDGTGYPDRLAGTAIPMGARILSVVDCFDALTSDRPYRPKLDTREAITILLSRKATMYDPLVVDAFLQLHEELKFDQSSPVDERPFLPVKPPSQALPLPEPSKRPLDEIAASSEEMLALLSLSSHLNARLGVSDAGDLVAKYLRRLVPFSLAVFFVHRPSTDHLLAVHAVGEDAGLVSGMTLNVGERLSGWVAANRRTIRNSDPALDLGEGVRRLTCPPRSCLSTPLVSEAHLVGVLSLYSPIKNGFTEEHQRLFEVISMHVSRFLDDAVRFDDARFAKLRDEITGLPTIEHLCQMFHPTGSVLNEPTTIAVVHLGDNNTDSSTLLALAAGAIRRSLRATDLLFKHDDRGFVVLLLRTTREAARLVIERIREALQAEPRHGHQHAYRLRIGLASSPNEGTSIEALLGRAADNLREEPTGRGSIGHTDLIH